MTAQHTPGPWFAKRGDTLNTDRSWGVVVPLTRDECESVDGDDSGFDANGDGRTVVVAEVCDSCDDAATEADARLIAAAPDLLAACDMALRWMVPHAGEGDPASGAVRRVLRSAISRATGGAS